jgi:hypothetical protein
MTTEKKTKSRRNGNLDGQRPRTKSLSSTTDVWVSCKVNGRYAWMTTENPEVIISYLRHRIPGPFNDDQRMSRVKNFWFHSI